MCRRSCQWKSVIPAVFSAASHGARRSSVLRLLRSRGRRENPVILEASHLRASLQQREGFAHQRQRPAFAILRFVQRDHLPIEINLPPAQRHDFGLPRSRGQGQDYRQIEVRMRTARGQQLLALIIGQETHAPLFSFGFLTSSHGFFSSQRSSLTPWAMQTDRAAR